MKNKNMVRTNRIRPALWFAGLVLTVLACAFILRAEARASANGRTEKSSPGKAGEAAVFEPDKGRFRILVNGQEVGKEQFEIAPSNGKWIARGTTDAQTAKGAAHVTGTLQLQPDGTPIRYDWSTQGARKASAAVTFAGATATIELHVENARPFTQQFTFPSPRIAVLDNNLNYQYAVLARLYDWNKKGQQTFSVLVPQELTPGAATVESLGKQDAGGKSLDELRVKTEDNEVDLYVDGSRLMRMVVPSANAEIVRE